MFASSALLRWPQAGDRGCLLDTTAGLYRELGGASVLVRFVAAMSAPKPLGVFILFKQQNGDLIRSKTRQDNGDLITDGPLPQGAVAKTAGVLWRGLSPAEKKPYQDQHDSMMIAWKASGGSFAQKPKQRPSPSSSVSGERKESGKSKKAKTDMRVTETETFKMPGGGGFCVYFTEHDAEITGALPAGTPRAEVFRVGGVRWWSLSPARRKVYEDKFIQSRSDFQSGHKRKRRPSPPVLEQLPSAACFQRGP